MFPSNLLFRAAATGVRRMCSSLEVTEFSSRILDPARMERLIAQPAKAVMFDKFLKVYPDFDGMIVKPLQDIAKLDPVSIINLLGIALSLHPPNTLGDFSIFETRLRIIQPDFVVTEVMNPLMRFGVTNPQRIVRRCPSLFVAAATRDGEQSRLLVALSTLNGLLTKKELASVVKAFPSVLTRSRDDLEKTYNYLTEVMGLEGSRSVMSRGSRSSRGAHENRHSTKLRLIASPAWRLSLRRVFARHSLLLFAGQWPPSIPQSVNKSRDRIVGQLLKCPPDEFSYWLEFHDGVSPSAEGTRVPVFSAEDVRQFEKICENLVSDDDDIGDFENEAGDDSDLDDEEYPEDKSDNEDHL
nr:conserved hypothetical protein [Hymenolepis microstoma]